LHRAGTVAWIDEHDRRRFVGVHDGDQVPDRARPHVGLLAMVARMVVELPLTCQCMVTEGMPWSTTRCSLTDPGG
jgi:hypothetical protein